MKAGGSPLAKAASGAAQAGASGGASARVSDRAKPAAGAAIGDTRALAGPPTPPGLAPTIQGTARAAGYMTGILIG